MQPKDSTTPPSSCREPHCAHARNSRFSTYPNQPRISTDFPPGNHTLLTLTPTRKTQLNNITTHRHLSKSFYHPTDRVKEGAYKPSKLPAKVQLFPLPNAHPLDPNAALTTITKYLSSLSTLPTASSHPFTSAHTAFL